MGKSLYELPYKSLNIEGKRGESSTKGNREQKSRCLLENKPLEAKVYENRGGKVELVSPITGESVLEIGNRVRPREIRRPVLVRGQVDIRPVGTSSFPSRK